MSLSTFVKTCADKTFKDLTPNIGKMFLITGAIGWVLSSVAQVAAVMINNKIPKDQKKFLIPQEMADAAVNIISFIVITRTVNKFGQNLVDRGKIISPAIKRFLEADSNKLMNKLGTKVEVLKKEGSLEKVKQTFSISKSEEFKQNRTFQDDFYKFYDGVDFLSSTIGAIISCNIVTPYLRNAIGAKMQKKSMKQMHTPQSPAPQLNNRLGIDDYKKMASLNLTRPNSSLKI